MHLDDTIVAIATPLGEGGLAVIRLSGARAFDIADKSFRPIGKSSLPASAAPTHTIQFGRIVRDENIIDEVLLAVLRAPRTFTREDTIEISCHGGLLPAKLVLDTLLAGGARLADPGEFTKRAFLHGRIDLAQAEAVADLIHSRTELALAAANEQLAGKLSHRINRLRDDLMHTLAHVEAQLDFPEEDIAPDTKRQLLQRLADGIAFMAELLHTANEGQILRRGIRAVIVGRPNAGKSSLLNQLLGRDRAMVSHLPGTTRDTIEETANIRGLPVVFIDTAGLRESQDELEREGIRRSRESLTQAELILHVLDASEPLTDADKNYLDEFAAKQRILVRNKTDLPVKLELPLECRPPTRLQACDGTNRAGSETGPPALAESKPAGPQTGAPIVDVCCLTGLGIESLKDVIKNLVWSGEIKAGMVQVAINARHQDALNRARAAARQAADALAGAATLELVAMDLRIAANAVGEIVGKTTTEDLLDSIFSTFCIGK
jgi:tRNA modification GTPase